MAALIETVCKVSLSLLPILAFCLLRPQSLMMLLALVLLLAVLELIWALMGGWVVGAVSLRWDLEVSMGVRGRISGHSLVDEPTVVSMMLVAMQALESMLGIETLYGLVALEQNSVAAVTVTEMVAGPLFVDLERHDSATSIFCDFSLLRRQPSGSPRHIAEIPGNSAIPQSGHRDDPKTRSQGPGDKVPAL